MEHECKFFNETTTPKSIYPEYTCIKCSLQWYKVTRINNYEYELINGELVKAPPVDYHLVQVKTLYDFLMSFV